MNDDDAWPHAEDAEPEHLRRILDALRDRPTSASEDEEQRAREFFERLEAALAEEEEPEPPCATGAPLARVEEDRLVGDEGLTVRSPTFDERAAAAQPAEPLVPSPPVAAPEPCPAEVRPPAALTITDIALDIPAEVREQLGRLPFRPRPPELEINQTKKVPVLELLKGKTAPVGDDSIAKARPVLPFSAKTASASVVPFPSLTLHQYASLWAELSVTPERYLALLRLYHLPDEAARRALDEHWHRQFAASPETRAMFEEAFAEFTAWLRTQRA